MQCSQMLRAPQRLQPLLSRDADTTFHAAMAYSLKLYTAIFEAIAFI